MLDLSTTEARRALAKKYKVKYETLRK